MASKLDLNIVPKQKKEILPDHWGTWASRISRKRQSLTLVFWTCMAKIKCYYWKVCIEKGCRFWGTIIFNRTPESSISIGKRCRFRSSTWSNLVGLNRPCIVCTLSPNAEIIIGDDSGFSATSITAMESIVIGNNVICGANVTITDTDWHHINPTERKDGTKGISEPVTIGDGVWLGLNVTILKGVSIGSGSVIAANSTVTRNIPRNVIAAGNPVKVIKNIPA